VNSEAVAAQQWADRARALKGEGWELTDLCGLDLIGFGDDPRFEVVCQLLHAATKKRVTVHIGAEGDPPTVPSVAELWPTSNFMEREAFDMFGIHFEGHPNLDRILMPDEWEGHPLRKDYGVGKVAIEFLPQPFLQIDAPGQSPNAEGAGRKVDELGQSGKVRRGPGNPPGSGDHKGVRS
jgi:NADH:ubiquinone oxidoreductase subunit C